jgi:peptidoglycan/xylan/chitin deacetylase (PgdA/CDA1 family)
MARTKFRVSLLAVVPLFLLFSFATSAPGQAQTSWVGLWAASQQRPEPSHALVAGNPASQNGQPESRAASSPVRAGSVSSPKMAITFDDLPAHSALPPGETRLEVATKVIASLRDAQAPPTYGFVNAVRIEEHPADAAVLRAWRDAGNPLGNHTWSHMNLNQNTLEAFEAEVTRNEPTLQESMNTKNMKEDWHWFRFPYLAEGDTPAKRAGIRTFFQQHGYKIAGVTMSFGDYLWNEPYARCRAKGDDKAVAMLETTYLAAADESITYYRGLSRTLFDRDIPYVLLMHIGAFDAEMLPRLLQLYRSRGFQFVTLEEAESDEFYREDTDLSLPPGPDSLEQAMSARHLPVPPHAAPVPQFDNLCR